MLLLALACVTPLPTANGAWVVPATDTPWVASRGPGSTSPVLAGSTVCVSPFGSALRTPMRCADLRLNDLALTGDCFVLPTTGPALLTVTPSTRCEGPLPPADTLSFPVVGAAGLTADFAFWVEEAVEQGVALGSIRATFPPDWRPAPGAVIPVAEGGKLTLAARLRDGQGQPVAWGSHSARVVDSSGAVVHDGDGSVELRPAPMGYRFEAGAATWPLPSTEAVAVDPTSLSVVVAHAFDPTVATERPFGARAILRDAGGRVVYGAAVSWTLEGPLLATEDPWDKGRLLLFGTCASRGGPQTATLAARFGDTMVREELRWEEPARKTTKRDRPAECRGERGGVTDRGGDTLTALVDRLAPLVSHP